MRSENLLSKDGEIYLYENFFNSEESSCYFKKLESEIIWKHEPIFLFGKWVMRPRLTSWYGDAEKSYRYSGVTMNPLPWTKSLIEIKESIETISEVIFNSVLLNFYRDGRDSVGWHRDNEKDLGVEPIIASVSFGATRIFKLQHLEEKTLIQSIELESGSLLLMKGKTQHLWKHCVPKMSKVIGPRINLTFRIIK